MEHTSLYAVWRWEQFPGAPDLDPSGSRGLVGFAAWGLDMAFVKMIFEIRSLKKDIGNSVSEGGGFFGGVGLE